MQLLPRDIDWHTQALGIGVKHDWLSWGGGGGGGGGVLAFRVFFP